MSYKQNLKNFNKNFLNDLEIEIKPYYKTSILNIILFKLKANNNYHFSINKNSKLYNYFNINEHYGTKFINKYHLNELIDSQIIK